MILFFGAMIVFMLFLALWVYKDAKVKSTHPPLMWVLIVTLVPNLVGLIVYLLIGRANKTGTIPAIYKRLVIISAICFVLSSGAFVGGILHLQNTVGPVASGTRQMGSFVGFEDNLRNGVWEISATRANGYSSRNPILSAEEMSAFRVESINDSGSIFLKIQQGDREEIFDISQNFNGYIDLSSFAIGRLTILMQFEHATNLNTTVSWR